MNATWWLGLLTALSDRNYRMWQWRSSTPYCCFDGHKGAFDGHLGHQDVSTLQLQWRSRTIQLHMSDYMVIPRGLQAGPCPGYQVDKTLSTLRITINLNHRPRCSRSKRHKKRSIWSNISSPRISTRYKRGEKGWIISRTKRVGQLLILLMQINSASRANRSRPTQQQ